MSGYTVDYIEKKLKEQLETSHLQVEDLSDGCGAKFHVFVVSNKFVGRPLIDRHRMVNEVLAEEMKSIHALTLKTLTPEQYAKISK